MNILFPYIKKGEDVIKYGYPIGTAIHNLHIGTKIDESNIKTKLGALLKYRYQPSTLTAYSPYLNTTDKQLTFMGYKRPNGTVATRNEVWVIPTVFCINNIVSKLGNIGTQMVKQYAGVDGVFAFPHPFGCSQMGNDHLTTQRVLAGMVNHPNAAAVLIVGLGCENNNIDEFKKLLGHYDRNRARILTVMN